MRSGCKAATLIIILTFSILTYFGPFSPSAKFAAAQSDTSDTDTQKRIDERLSLAADKLRKVEGEKVPLQYIVVLKDSNAQASSVRALADEARVNGTTVRHVYEHALKGFAIKISNERALQALLKNPRVDYIQPDLRVKGFAQSLPTGVDRVDGDLSTAKSGDGGGGAVNVDIAIVDTGIDLNHPDLNIYKQTSFVSGTSNGNDDGGHGTLVAGVIAAKDDSQGVVGLAPGGRLWAVKVLDSSGQGFDSDIIAGIDYITANAGEIDVANLSWGGDGPDEALHTAIKNSVAAGVTYVAAAGNDDRDAGGTVPANFPEVITVSAIVDTDGKCGGKSSTSTSAGKDDSFASFSNYGSVVDLAAPGVLVKTTSMGSSYGTFSGTSASAPHVTGAAALYKSEHQGASPSEVRNALINSGSSPSTVCDGKGHGYFTGDPDSIREPLLYVGNPTNTVTDATPPTVTANSPVGGASNVATSSQITATFSEAVQASTVSTSTFILKNSAGSSIPGTVSLTGTDNPKATFTPSSSLAFSTSYTATISNVKDLAGNTMSPSKSWSFNTGADPSAPPSTPPPSSSCSNNLHINKATSSGSKGSSGPSKAIDNKFSTKWISKSISKPWIRADLGTSKTICSVGIAWADGTSRQYSFVISGSADGSVYINVYSGKSKGTTKATETYSFADSAARYVKVTISKGVSGSSKISAQISELDIFGKAGSSSISGQSDVFSSSSDSGTVIEGQTPSGESIKNSGPDNNSVNDNSVNDNSVSANNNDSPPSARDDRIRTEQNKPAVIAVLANDKDADGDKIKIISVSSPKNGGTVMINENDTITFVPERNFVGVDTFSYVIADSEGKTDQGKVSAYVREVTDEKQPEIPRQPSSTKGLSMNPQASEQEQQKQILDTTAQKIKVKVLIERPDEMEIAAFGLPHGAIVANNSTVNDNMQPN
jgi:subtilisin family serine protease